MSSFEAKTEAEDGYDWPAKGYLTLLAWIVATLFYQITIGHQMLWILIPLILLDGIVCFFRWLGSRNSFPGSMALVP